MSAPSPNRKLHRSVLVVVFFLILITGAGYLGWRFFSPYLTVDMEDVFRLNNLGIGQTEQFQYQQAASTFADIVHKVPKWLPGRINLGIALLNTASPENLDRAREVFTNILREQPDNPHAHFCLGIILRYQGRPEERAVAAAHFEAVTRLDPDDAAAWYWLGTMKPEGSAEATACFRHAVRLDPNLSGALYGLFINLRQEDPNKANQVLAEYEASRDSRFDGDTRGNVINTKYGEMGRYGEVIGAAPIQAAAVNHALPLFIRNDGFTVDLAPGVSWAKSEEFGKNDLDLFRQAVRARFGGTLVVLDYDQDGKPDVFMLGAGLKNGQVIDLLLHNEGNGHFRDVTALAGLVEPRASLGCCVADVDNDGFPDLLITGIDHVWLFRNSGKGTFEDISTKAGLANLRGVFLGAALVDLDQDGDLDLVLARFADDLQQAAHKVQNPASLAGGGAVVLINTGEAPPQEDRGSGAEPLSNPRFRPIYEVSALLPGGLVSAVAMATAFAGENLAKSRLMGATGSLVNIAVADIDGDRDLDLLMVSDRQPAAIVWNDRLLRFHRSEIPATVLPGGAWNGCLVLDINNDGRSDFLLVGRNEKPVLLRNRSNPSQTDSNHWFETVPTNAPSLIQAQAVDLDLDGLTDVVGLSAEHLPVFLHNDGQRLIHRPEALGKDTSWPKDLVAITVADFTGDGYPDLLLWSEKTGLAFYLNRGNGNHSLALSLTGRRGTETRGVKVRTNADGFGVIARSQAGDVAASVEKTTLNAGLGHGSIPILLGLGRHTQADVLRLRWPDGVWQAELHLPSDRIHHIAETNRKETSCPILFAWNGRRFEFISDFLGAGSVGEPILGGGYRPPRPEESIKIDPEQLIPRAGEYILKIAEPMDEVTLLDRLQLLAIDHPADVRVYPDERFGGIEPLASQDVVAFRQEIFPVRARDQRGRDVTRTLAKWDRDMVDQFSKRAWLGFAEDHWVELDFGDRLASFGPKDRLLLCLAGWTDYAYPESIWAAAQAGVAMQSPILEQRIPDGRWRTVIEDVGFPAGLPRMMTVDVTGKIGGPKCVLRLRTNLEVYWDQVFVAPLVDRLPTSFNGAEVGCQSPAGVFRVTPLAVASADLLPRPCMKEVSPDGRAPAIYDYDQLESIPVARLAGRLTRFGDVTELLREADDRYVLFGPGDDVTVRFDARPMPALPTGWKRSFILKTWGYCKDCTPFSDTGETIEPLPFRAMKAYPPDSLDPYPGDFLHKEYRKKFNTRRVGPPPRK